jgi:hypothetical protein
MKKTHGQIAYEKWLEYFECQSRVYTWESQGKRIQGAWESSAKAVLDAGLVGDRPPIMPPNT